MSERGGAAPPLGERIACAEHELRGAAAALSLACAALRRDPAASGHAAAIEAQLDRLRAGLADLEEAREGAAPADPVATEPEPEPAAPGDPRPEPAAPELVDLGELARAAALPFPGASFRWEGGPASARLDRRRLAKALGNVLANAAEHGEGDFQVTGRARDGGVRLEVRNRGRGLTIASRAAAELGGRLSFEIDGDSAVATLELPAE